MKRMYEDFLAVIRGLLKMETETKQGVTGLRNDTMSCSSSASSYSSSSSKITSRVELPRPVQSYEDSYQLKRGQPRTRTRTRTRAAGLCWLQAREGARLLTEV